MDSATQNRLASADISGDQAFVFYETALDGASFLRDFVPAFLIMAVALVLSVWLPVEADTGLRPVESSVGDCRFAVGDILDYRLAATSAEATVAGDFDR